MALSKETKEYYDDFSNVYERHRHHGYHRMLDDLEFSIVSPYVKGKRVLEAGCGTGLILKRVAKIAKSACGIDLSPGMLAHARNRGLDCYEADLCNIPFEDESFDTVYSFKVLPHVEQIETALKELARVCKPGGHLVLEFYNPHSLRGIIKRLKPPSNITGNTKDSQVFTRYDSYRKILGMLPGKLELIECKGIRIITPIATVHKIPVLGKIFGKIEETLVDSPLKVIAGFSVIILQKTR